MQVGREIAEPHVPCLSLPQRAGSPSKAKEGPTVLRARRFPLKPALESHDEQLVPVFTGSLWNNYEPRFRVKLGYSFGVVTTRESRQVRMVRTITGPDIDEQVQRFRQLCHPNIVKTVEIYTSFHQGDNFLVSEFMATSLWHVCRAPKYPNERQLSSILHQVCDFFGMKWAELTASKVLSSVKFLLENNLVHEQLSAANILMNHAGEVKVSDTESCRRDGDGGKLGESFSRLMMKLMDKEKSDSATIGLSHPDRWSHKAIDMFTTAVSKPGVKALLAHEFLQERQQTELIWFVYLVQITAKHERD
jgi:serine/threonine protein kinase